MFRAGWLLLPIAVLLSIAALSPKDVKAVNSASNRAGYTGDSACLPCHKEQSLTYLHTGHHLTSQLPNSTSIRGSFRENENVLTIRPENDPALPSLRFLMNEKDGSFFETAITGFGSQLQQRTERIDLVTGSGKRGQTYLYWQGDRLFELPVSYWSDGHRWINSPGYDDGTAIFSRPIAPGCMECHATYLQPLSDDSTNRFERRSFIPGISCETCHGPGAAHVALQQQQPKHAPKPSDEVILNPASFTRDRQIDLCAYCHNGAQVHPIAPAFSYRPGKPLADFFKPVPAPTSDHPDVHGNQVGLLELSRCFRSSPSMTCSTCHDVHAPERAAVSYSARCLTCHQWQSCKVAKKIGHQAASNCIDCHMPVLPTNKIVSETGGKELHASMRSHWIKIYPQTIAPTDAPVVTR